MEEKKTTFDSTITITTEIQTKNMKTKLILALFIPFFYSCIETLPDEELTMIRTPYNGKEIRLDGYYSGLNYQSGNTTYIQYMFFYSNGIMYTSFGYDSNIKDIDKIVSLMDKDRNIKRHWAIFQVKKDTITIQGWRLRDYVYQNYAYNYRYKIINDTTLFYENSLGVTTKFYFKKYSPKLDSTNVFIK